MTSPLHPDIPAGTLRRVTSEVWAYGATAGYMDRNGWLYYRDPDDGRWVVRTADGGRFDSHESLAVLRRTYAGA